MKIRLLFVALICALAAGPGAFAAEAETELGGKMEKLSSTFRLLRRQVADSSKNADSLAKIATIRQLAEESTKLEPAKKAELPPAEQKKFVENYRAEMKKFIDMVGKAEAALKAGKNEEAGKILAAIGDHQKKSHKAFKSDKN